MDRREFLAASALALGFPQQYYPGTPLPPGHVDIRLLKPRRKRIRVDSNINVNEPILIDRNYIIIDGHVRYKHALEEGRRTIAANLYRGGALSIWYTHLHVPHHLVRSPNPRAVRDLERSIEKIGMINPICVAADDTGFTITDGYHRFIAARNLGHVLFPCYDPFTGRDGYTDFYTSNHSIIPAISSHCRSEG